MKPNMHAALIIICIIRWGFIVDTVDNQLGVNEEAMCILYLHTAMTCDNDNCRQTSEIEAISLYMEALEVLSGETGPTGETIFLVKFCQT